jgi:putative redox protein
MAETTPTLVVDLTWDEGLRFTASHKSQTWILDGRNEAGPSPVVALASSLAGCMAIDLVHILTKGRHSVNALAAQLTAERAGTDPKYITRIDLLFTVATSAPLDAIERAVELSHEKYCSVWHSLRQDIAFHTGIEVRQA